MNKKCQVEKVITNPLDPYDVEDLALGPDGTLWLSDTGDNNKNRATVAVTTMTPAGKATLHRLTYPDGPHDTKCSPNLKSYRGSRNPAAGQDRAGKGRACDAQVQPTEEPAAMALKARPYEEVQRRRAVRTGAMIRNWGRRLEMSRRRRRG